MKIVAVIPIKLNNRRLPGKNITPFTNGEPLCTYIQNTLKSCKNIDEIYIYCSDETIKKYLVTGIKYLQRSADLDTDQTSIIDVLCAFAKEVPADIYVLCHATAPFISKESIQKGLDAVISRKYDSSFSATMMQDFMWSYNKPINYKLTNIPRTQDLSPIYIESSGFYIFTKEVIKAHRRIGNTPKIIEISKIESIDIDEKEDFEMADAMFNYNKIKCGGGALNVLQTYKFSTHHSKVIFSLQPNFPAEVIS